VVKNGKNKFFGSPLNFEKKTELMNDHWFDINGTLFFQLNSFNRVQEFFIRAALLTSLNGINVKIKMGWVT
jgi:uncharacterized membrane protein YcgQ (UPF0703/DUF1980 family)